MFGLNRWNDNRDHYGLSKLQRDIDKMFDDFLTPSRMWNGNDQPTFNPACDVEEDENQYLVSFDVPGISKDDIKIDLMNNVLTVSGERKTEREDKKNSQHLVERSYGQFRRTFALPATVEADKVEANYSDGVLTISIPKSEVAKPRQIKIGDAKPSLFRRLSGMGANESAKQNDKKDRAA